MAVSYCTVYMQRVENAQGIYLTFKKKMGVLLKVKRMCFISFSLPIAMATTFNAVK